MQGPYLIWPILLGNSCQKYFCMELEWLTELPRPCLFHRGCYMLVIVKLILCRSNRAVAVFFVCMMYVLINYTTKSV